LLYTTHITKKKENIGRMEDKKNETLSDEYHKTIVNLKILSTIREHDKLRTNDGIHIDRYENKWVSLTRWWNVENRNLNTVALVDFFQKTYLLCDKLQTKENKTVEDIYKFNRLKQEIYNAKKGVANMVSTYRTDAYVMASLQLLHDQITDKLEVLSSDT